MPSNMIKPLTTRVAIYANVNFSLLRSDPTDTDPKVAWAAPKSWKAEDTSNPKAPKVTIKLGLEAT